MSKSCPNKASPLCTTNISSILCQYQEIEKKEEYPKGIDPKLLLRWLSLLREKKRIRHSGWVKKFGRTENRVHYTVMDVMTASFILGYISWLYKTFLVQIEKFISSLAAYHSWSTDSWKPKAKENITVLYNCIKDEENYIKSQHIISTRQQSNVYMYFI